MAEERKRKYMRGNLFGDEETCLIEVSPKFYVMLMTGMISDEALDHAHENLMRGPSEPKNDSEASLDQKVQKETLENAYLIDPGKVDYGEAMFSHTEAYHAELSKMDSLIYAIEKGLENRKDGNGNGKYKKIVDQFATLSINTGEKLFKEFENISPQGMDEFALRNEIYKKLKDFDNELTKYFAQVNNVLAKNMEFEPEKYNVLSLLHGFSRICTRLLAREKDAGIVRPEVTRNIDDNYETVKYKKEGGGYMLDEVEEARADLRDRIDKDINHRMKDLKGKYNTDTGIEMSAQEVKYDNLNFLDDATIHIIKFVFGLDVDKDIA